MLTGVKGRLECDEQPYQGGCEFAKASSGGNNTPRTAS